MSFSWLPVLLAILGLPWLVDAPLQSSPQSPHDVLPLRLGLCLSVFYSSPEDASPVGLRTHPNPV